MTQERDDEFELLLARALKARPEPASPSNLAATALGRAVAGTRPRFVPGARLVWTRRAQSLASALAFTILLVLAIDGVRVWSSLATDAAQESSASASQSSSDELGLIVGLSCVLTAAALFALERAFSTEREGLGLTWRPGIG
jgi:hypothetical protein